MESTTLVIAVSNTLRPKSISSSLEVIGGANRMTPDVNAPVILADSPSSSEISVTFWEIAVALCPAYGVNSMPSNRPRPRISPIHG